MTSRRRALAELDQDIRDHIEREIQDNLSRGMTPEEARRAALLSFGNVALVKENTRAVWIPAWFDQLIQDAHYGLRILHRNPGFTVMAVVMLALGIGVNGTAFMVSHALFKGFQFVKNDRIVYLRSRNTNHPQEYYGVSWPDFEDWRTQAKSFEGMAACLVVGPVSLGDKSGLSETYYATEVSANIFKLVGDRPIIGRDFAPSDEIPGAAPVAILTYGLWERLYGKNPEILGRTVRINGTPTTVVGVMAKGFSFPLKQDLWIPAARRPPEREARDLMFVVGRLADGATIRSARTEMENIGTGLASAYPLTNRGFIPVAEDFNEMFHGARQTLVCESMLGAADLVLLIACANLANLMLARSISRSHEISLRMALGAGRWRIVRQLLIESLMVSLISGVFGGWIAVYGVRAYEAAAFPLRNRHAPPWYDFTMDYRVLGYLVAISIGIGLLSGLAPTIRLSTLDVNAALKGGGPRAGGRSRRKHLYAVLVVGEIALAMVLLAAAGAMIHSFLNIYAKDVGVKAENILAAYLPLPYARYPNPEAQISFYDRLKTQLEAVPGVESVTVANSLPTSSAQRVSYELETASLGGSEENMQRLPTLLALIIGPAYCRTVGAAVLAGREFNDSDGASGIPAVMVDQRFAAKYWPGEGPLGKHLRLFDRETPGPWLTVVGVVSNIVQNDRAQQEPDPLVYLPYRQYPGMSMYALVRTRVRPGNLMTAFRREVQELDSDLPVINLQPLAEYLERNYWNIGFYAIQLAVFAGIALILASVGLYAVISHTVSQRTQEIGLRMAVGAAAGDIFKLVFRQGMLPLGLGLTIGLAATFAITPILKSVLVQASPVDPIALGVASVVLVLAAMVGCLIPALRAMGGDPAVALRHE